MTRTPMTRGKPPDPRHSQVQVEASPRVAGAVPGGGVAAHGRDPVLRPLRVGSAHADRPAIGEAHASDRPRSQGLHPLAFDPTRLASA